MQSQSFLQDLTHPDRILQNTLNKTSYTCNSKYAIVVSKIHSNEVIQFSYEQVKHEYSLPRAYAVFCGRFNITVN